MPTITTELLADGLNVSVYINDKPIEITSLEYKAKLDTGRQVSFKVSGENSVHHCYVGSKIRIKSGRGREVSNLSFAGLIKEITPTVNGAIIVGIDYMTSLATSSHVNYTNNEVIGRDLYFLARNAMNIPDIDTTFLTQGSYVSATEGMGLTGLQTRKEFVQKCIDNMYFLTEDSTSYASLLNIVYYNYAIHRDNVMDIIKIDADNIHIKPVLKINMTNNIVENLAGVVDASRIVNSYTIESSTNKNLTYTHNDNDSIRKHGVLSELVSVETSNFPLIVNTTQKFVDKNLDPSLNFTFTLRNAEHLALGDIVEVTHPLSVKAIKLPISEYGLTTKDGISTTITLGRKRLTLAETIAKSL
jgi:hypothetical protein